MGSPFPPTHQVGTTLVEEHNPGPTVSTVTKENWRQSFSFPSILRCFLSRNLTCLTSWGKKRVKAWLDHLWSSRNKERRQSPSDQHMDLCGTSVFIPDVVPSESYQSTSQPTRKAELIFFRSTVGSSTRLESLDGQSPCPGTQPTPATPPSQGNAHLCPF